MAFHVACPITCRKVCFCQMGFTGSLRTQEGRKEFMQEVARIVQFLNDPWLIKSSENAMVHVLVPKVVVNPAPPAPPVINGPVLKVTGSEGEGTAVKPAALAHTKRIVLQKQLVAAEAPVKKIDYGDLVRDADGGEQRHSNSKGMCRMCFTGENEGGEKVRQMLSCNACGKKYHQNCLKRWSQNRDLFHWSSWTCPSCRTCEVCLKTGDPSKFMFCKRCDGAYHCYCQQPPHKNVGHGPYLCPKHTRCHSCGSSVPGNGLSVRWFLGYTCCDACGRLFVKGNFCPVCLKVYRDSESTPMVCCDVCQRWVHCPCDGISDSKYMEFQVDGNLQYVCPTCRGECSQIGTFEDAVQELWRRRDEADKELILRLKTDAGLPTQEEIFDNLTFSEDEDSSPLSKVEYGRSLKFSLKGFTEKSPKKSKENAKSSLNKVHVKKKGGEASLTSGTNASQSFGVQTDLVYRADVVHQKNEKVQFSGEQTALSPVTGSFADAIGALNETAVSYNRHVDEAAANSASNPSKTIKIKSKKSTVEEVAANSGAAMTASGRKLVIHLGGRSRTTSSPTKSEAVSVRTDQDFISSGTEDSSKLKHIERIDRTVAASDKKVSKKVHTDQVKSSKSRGKEGQVVKLRKVNSGASGIGLNPAAELSEEDPVSQRNANSVSRKGASIAVVNFRNKSSKYAEDSSDTINGTDALLPVSRGSTKDQKPYLKIKIPKSSNEGNQTGPVSSGTLDIFPLHGKDELIYTRGQRSKRKRPALAEDENPSQLGDENTMRLNDLTDANWVLQKLGKDAVGKRVEVHQPSSDSWRRGTVVEVVEDSSTVSVALEEGMTKSFQLGKQGIRFVSKKRKQ